MALEQNRKKTATKRWQKDSKTQLSGNRRAVSSAYRRSEFIAKYYQIDDIDMMDECFDLEKSFYWYKEAAKQGCVEAMLMVGKMCLENGMDDEDVYGNEWIERAAALGDLSAIFELGVRHMAGCGYKEDSEEGMPNLQAQHIAHGLSCFFLC